MILLSNLYEDSNHYYITSPQNILGVYKERKRSSKKWKNQKKKKRVKVYTKVTDKIFFIWLNSLILKGL